MMAKKGIACIGFWSEYDQQFFENARLPDYPVSVLNPYQHLAQAVPPAYLIKPLRTYFLRKAAEKLIKQHSDQHIVIHDERVMLDAMLSCSNTLSVSVLMRNSLIDSSKISQPVLALKELGHTIWSFDPRDCDQHQFLLYHQFISKTGLYENTPIKTDFGFLGKDKGRKEQLDSLCHKLTEMGYQCHIDLRVGARKKDSGLLDKPYADYLEQVCSARCIIDIVQDQQAGITLRPLEAAIYQRKLMTNSEQVRALPFYHPDNIFILGKDSWDRLATFMETPFLTPEKTLLEPYMTESILKHIVLSGRK